MNIEDLLVLARKSALTIILFMIFGIAASGVYLLLQKPSYSTTSTVYVTVNFDNVEDKSQAVGVFNSASQITIQKAQAYVPLFGDRSTAAEVSVRLGLTEPVEQLAENIKANNVRGTSTIEVTATAATVESARKIADTASIVVGERIQDLEGKSSPVQLKLLSPADLSQPVRHPIAIETLLVGALIGLVLGVVVSIVRSQLDTKVRKQEDLRQFGQIPILSTIPESESIKEYKNDGSAFEYVRKIRTSLYYTAVDSELKSVLVTSSLPSEGKSSVAAALAKVIAYSGRKVLLIDADLRYPTVERRFCLDTKIGLTQVLSGAVDVDLAIQETEVDHLFVLPSGEQVPNPSELLGSKKMEELLASIEHDYFVIVDGPPVLPVTDSAVLASRVDSTIVVAGVGVATVDSLTRTVELLEKSRAYLAGFVLNMVNEKQLPNSKYDNKYLAQPEL